jgi:L-asparaginase/Glu-tRNA(Gln) amidotransferase subunit D
LIKWSTTGKPCQRQTSPWASAKADKDVFHAIKYARRKNIPVVVAGRVRYGGVYALYGDEGGSSLIRTEAFLSGELSPCKARLLLMIAPAQHDMTSEKLKRLFSPQ